MKLKEKLKDMLSKIGFETDEQFLAKFSSIWKNALFNKNESY